MSGNDETSQRGPQPLDEVQRRKLDRGRESPRSNEGAMAGGDDRDRRSLMAKVSNMRQKHCTGGFKRASDGNRETATIREDFQRERCDNVQRVGHDGRKGIVFY
ncbi:hypothetical protein NL676_025630 [Syzygium grande]|nr:hypothetical protein NL676_025630 [Syzygium grande]